MSSLTRKIMIVLYYWLGRAYEDLFKNYRQDVEVTFDEFGLSENWSFLQGRFVIKLIPVNGGETLQSKGKYLEIHKRQPDGSLKFYHHMWSEDERVQWMLRLRRS